MKKYLFLLLPHRQTLTFACTTREVFPNSSSHHGRQIVSNWLTFKIERIIPSHMLNKASKSKIKPRKNKRRKNIFFLFNAMTLHPPPTLQMIKLFFESLTSYTYNYQHSIVIDLKATDLLQRRQTQPHSLNTQSLTTWSHQRPCVQQWSCSWGSVLLTIAQLDTEGARHSKLVMQCYNLCNMSLFKLQLKSLGSIIIVFKRN